MERIARGDFLAGQIDSLLESVGLENDDLIDYITTRPDTPNTVASATSATSLVCTRTSTRTSTRASPALWPWPRTWWGPARRRRWWWWWRWRWTPWPWLWSWPWHTSTRTYGSRRIATSNGFIGRRCSSTVGGAPNCRHHAYQYHYYRLQGWRRTRSVSYVLAFIHPNTPNTIYKSTKKLWDDQTMPRRRRRRQRSQRGGVSPSLITGIFKTAHKTTRAIGERQETKALERSKKQRAEVESGKRKKYGGESFNCPFM